MKKILFVSLLLIYSNVIISQTHLSFFRFRSQSQIDSFPIKYPNVVTMDGISIVDSTNSIVDVSPLKQIKKVRGFVAINNPKLKKIELFNEIANDTIYDFLIEGNPLLDTLIIFKKAKYNPDGFTIKNQQPLYIECFDDLDSAYYILISLPKEGTSYLKGFYNVKSMFIGGLTGSIVIDGFNKLEYVSSSLSLGASTVLNSMLEFRSLKYVNWFTIGNISRPFSLSGLESLETVNRLTISGIDSLISFNTLKNVKKWSFLDVSSIKGNIDFGVLNNPASIHTLRLLDINGELKFSGVTFDSLKQLVLINTKVNESNFNLNSMAQKFTKFNSDETSPLFKYRNNSIILAENPALDFCNSKAICDLINAIPHEDIYIENNGTNCSDIETVIQQCIVDVDDISDNFSVFPNPFSDVIKVTGNVNDCKISLYNASGTLIKTDINRTDNTISVKTSDLDGGLYMLRIVNKENLSLSKLLYKY